MRIITVTLNPALDKTARLDKLRPGGLNRLGEVLLDAGGKGVNVSKTIAALGGTSTASGFAGGGAGGEILHALERLGIDHDFVRIAGSTRTNLKIVAGDGGLTELNEPGPAITAEEFAELEEKLRGWAGGDALCVFSGSVPKGVGPDVYARLIRLVHAAGGTAFLDADGEAFAAALAEGPAFVKPNRFELFQYFGETESGDLTVMLRLCRKLLDRGVRRLALSLGSAGALFVKADEIYHAPGLAVEARSCVGAGDSMVGAAAYGLARGMSWRDTAALALATSAGAVTTMGTKPPDRRLVEELLGRVELRRMTF